MLWRRRFRLRFCWPSASPSKTFPNKKIHRGSELLYVGTMKKLFCLAFLSIAANATIIYVDSEASNTINSSSHPTLDLAGRLHPNPAWAAPLPDSDWISYGSTGDPSVPGYFSPPDGLVVMFTTHFTLIGAITGGSLDVLADDSTSVILNGHKLIAADTKRGSKCSKAAIGCLASTEGIFTFAQLAPYLVDGRNTLSFGIEQIAGSSFGLDFAGQLDDAPTPEPATVAFIGAGLIGLIALRLRT